MASNIFLSVLFWLFQTLSPSSLIPWLVVLQLLHIPGLLFLLHVSNIFRVLQELLGL